MELPASFHLQTWYGLALNRTVCATRHLYQAAGLRTPVCNLDRDQALQLLVFGLVDDAHPAFAELFGDLVVADGLADQDGDIVPL